MIDRKKSQSEIIRERSKETDSVPEFIEILRARLEERKRQLAETKKPGNVKTHADLALEAYENNRTIRPIIPLRPTLEDFYMFHSPFDSPIEWFEWNQEPVFDFELPHAQKSFTVMADIYDNRATRNRMIRGSLHFQQVRSDGKGYVCVRQDDPSASNTLKMKIEDEDNRWIYYVSKMGKKMFAQLFVEEIARPGVQRVYNMDQGFGNGYLLRLAGTFDLDYGIQRMLIPTAHQLTDYEQAIITKVRKIKDTIPAMPHKTQMNLAKLTYLHEREKEEKRQRKENQRIYAYSDTEI